MNFNPFPGFSSGSRKNVQFHDIKQTRRITKSVVIFTFSYIYSEQEGTNFSIILAQKVKLGSKRILSFQTVLSNSQKLTYKN